MSTNRHHDFGKDTAKMIRQAEERGWTAKSVKSGCLLQWHSGEGQAGQVTVHRTASDRWALTILATKIRRIEQAAQ